MPSTAREMSAYAVKSTTGVSGQRDLSSPSHHRPSFPLLYSASKFMSSSTASGRNSSMRRNSSLGDGSSSTSSKCRGSRIFSAWRIPALSSTTSIFPFAFVIVRSGTVAGTCKDSHFGIENAVTEVRRCISGLFVVQGVHRVGSCRAQALQGYGQNRDCSYGE